MIRASIGDPQAAEGEDEPLAAETGRLPAGRFPDPLRAHAREARFVACDAHSSTAGDSRCQADTLQRGKDRGKIASSIGLDKTQIGRERADTTAIHFDQKSQGCVRGCSTAPPSVRYRR